MEHVNPKSKAFRRGFFDGFTAYFGLFAVQQYPRTRGIDPSVSKAWQGVGDALRKADKVERGKIGKITGKIEREANIAA